jgi:hypothetical protein
MGEPDADGAAEAGAAGVEIPAVGDLHRRMQGQIARDNLKNNMYNRCWNVSAFLSIFYFFGLQFFKQILNSKLILFHCIQFAGFILSKVFLEKFTYEIRSYDYQR